MAEGDETKYRYLRRQKCREIKKKMRVHSHKHPYGGTKMYMELKPKLRPDLEAICDCMFNIKVVDMGNACYTDRHYSDVI